MDKDDGAVLGGRCNHRQGVCGRDPVPHKGWHHRDLGVLDTVAKRLEGSGFWGRLAKAQQIHTGNTPERGTPCTAVILGGIISIITYHHVITHPPPVGADNADITSRRDTVNAGGGAARRLRAGPKAGPGTAVRLEAGSCREGFACLFQVCAALPHQACTDGSVFFRRRLSKAGLLGFAPMPRLLWALAPAPPSGMCARCSRMCPSFS